MCIAMTNYDGRILRLITNSTNGDAGSETLFFYHEKDDLMWQNISAAAFLKECCWPTKGRTARSTCDISMSIQAAN
jgi:hypothetical protein